MKSTVFIFSAIACLCMGVNKPAQAQTVATANQLEIGPTGANQVTNTATTYSGAIGSGNSVAAPGSFAVGFNNGISLYSSGQNASIVVGVNNSSTGIDCAVFGVNNTLWQDEGAGAICALVSGWGNQNTLSNSSAMFGDGNVANYASFTLTAGSGLVNNWNFSTVVGKYNSYEDGEGLLFVVGKGTDATHRSNALEVYSDGTVVVNKAQGDILMGQFGN